MHSFRESLFALGLSCTLLPMLAVAQSTLHVPSEYSTIAAAVAAASDGDTVEIAPGTYYESGIQVEAAIEIRGSLPNQGAVTLDASSAALFHAFGVDSLRLENLTLQNGVAMHNESYPAHGDGGGAVLLVDTDFSASHCWFVNNLVQARYASSRTIDMVPASGGAVFVTGTGTARLDNCHFEGNGITGNPGNATPGTLFRSGGALAVDGALEMESCSFEDNYLYLTGDSDTAKGGALSAGSITATDCQFTGNQMQLHGGTYLAAQGSAVCCSGNQSWQDCAFLDNDFTSTATPYGHIDGSALWGEATFSAGNCVFANNNTYFRSVIGDRGGSAIRAVDGELSNCTFYGNASAISGASQDVPRVAVYMLNNLDLETSIFAFNTDAPVYAGSVSASCTDVYDNSFGDWTGSFAGLGSVNGNLSEDPLFNNPTTNDFGVQPTSPCQAANNSCNLDMGSRLSLVESDGLLLVPSEYPSIAAAAAAAASGDIIELAADSYNEHDIPLYVSLTIRGAVADSGAVVINAQAQGRHFSAENLPAGITIENLTLINGEQSADYALYGQGGSLFLANTDLRAINCWFVDNHALYDNGNNYSAYGGAIYSEGAAELQFAECAFHRCSIEMDYLTGVRTVYQHGGSICTDGAVSLESCRFDECSLVRDGTDGGAHGGVIYAATITANDCVFRNCFLNSDGYWTASKGSIAYTSGEQEWIYCQFLDNINPPAGSNYFGSLLFSETDISCEGNTFSGNVSTFWGAGRNDGGSLFHASNLSLTSCTLHNNSSLTSDGYPEVLAYASSSMQIENCLISGNADAPALLESGASLDVDCTNICGNTAGDWSDELAAFAGVDGNISANPAFCDPEAGELGLQAHSPCLPANNSCGVLMGAWPENCASNVEIVFSDPFPCSETGTPATTGDEGIAVTISSPSGFQVDGASLQMRVDYDGDGFDADPREQWYALTGYTSADSIRVVEQLTYLEEISESDVEVEISASLVGFAQTFTTSINLHVDRIAPAAVTLALISNQVVSVTIGFDSSTAADFAAYRILVSDDSLFDDQDRVWSINEDPALGISSTTQTTVSGLVLEEEYWFTIQVLDQVGNASECSNPVYYFVAVGSTVLHVPSEFATIGEAVDASSPGTTIEIAAGTYNEHDIIIPHPLIFRGAIADSGGVVIDANSVGRHFTAPNIASGVRFENLCLINGLMRLGGGSIFVSNSPLVIRNCDFVGNEGYSDATNFYFSCTPHSAYGGALLITGSQLATLSDCAFHSNAITCGGFCAEGMEETRSQLGGALYSQGPVVLENSRFYSNSVESDAGMPLDNCSAGALRASTINATSCIFMNNAANPGYNTTTLWLPAQATSVAVSPGPQTYSNCVFIDNIAIHPTSGLITGEVARSSTQITVSGCTFAGNQSGGSSSINGSLLCAPALSLSSSTFYNNSTFSLDSGPVLLIHADNTLDIQGCIFTANLDSIAYCEGTTSVSCTDSYNNTLGNWTGSLNAFEGINGNVSLNPAFCNAPAYEFGLQEASPCLPENNSCGELIGALPQTCGVASCIEFTSPFPYSENGLPVVTGDDGVAITVSSTTDDEVDASSLCMRVDYDGDGFDTDAREQWVSLSGYTSDFSIRIDEALTYLGEVTESDIEVEFGAHTTAETSLNYASILMHIDRVAPDAVSLSLMADHGSSVDLQFTSSSASDFSTYKIWVSNDATIDASDRVWSEVDDPALALVATTQTSVTGLVDGIAYWFAIEVKDQAGNVSSLSNAVERSGANGHVLRVPAEYASIGAALQASAEGDIILLAAGTYYSNNLYTNHSVTIRGESADSAAVVIDAEWHSSHVRAYADSLLLINLTLKNGLRTDSNPLATPCGGSVYFSGHYFYAENCVWYNNTAHGDLVFSHEVHDYYWQSAFGGALYLARAAETDSMASAELTGCRFYNSTAEGVDQDAQGGAIYTARPLRVVDSRISASLAVPGTDQIHGNNSIAAGAGIFSSSELVLTNCVLDNNHAQPGEYGGLYVSRGAAVYCTSDVRLTGCRIFGNSTGSADDLSVIEGLAVYCTGNVEAESCLIHSHSVESQPWDPIACDGFVIRSYSCELSNCTIYGNEVTGGETSPRAIYSNTGMSLVNCLIAGNAGMSCPLSTSGTLAVSCTDIYGNSADWTGVLAPFVGVNGNLCANPLFVDAPNDLHLLPASPCLPENNSCDVLMGALGEGVQEIPAIVDLVAQASGSDVLLSWTNPAPTLVSGFEIHMGSEQGFLPNETTLVATTTGTEYTLTPASQDCIGFLRVVAVGGSRLQTASTGGQAGRAR